MVFMRTFISLLKTDYLEADLDTTATGLVIIRTFMGSPYSCVRLGIDVPLRQRNAVLQAIHKRSLSSGRNIILYVQSMSSPAPK